MDKRLMSIGLMAFTVMYSAYPANTFGRFAVQAIRTAASSRSKKCGVVLGAMVGSVAGATAVEKTLRWRDLGKKPFDTILAKRWTVQDGEYECPDEILLHTRNGNKVVLWIGAESNCEPRSEKNINYNYQENHADKSKASIICPPNSNVQLKRDWNRAPGKEDVMLSYATFSSIGTSKYCKITCREHKCSGRHLVTKAHGDIIDISLKYPTRWERLKNWYYGVTSPVRGRLIIQSDIKSMGK